MPFSDKQGNSYLASGFKYGYRNREDALALRREVLVSPSQNVLTGITGRVGSRKGYTIDGQTDESGNGKGIKSKFDWISHLGFKKNVRSGFKTSVNDGTVQFRYVATAGDKLNGDTLTEGQVVWITLKDDLYGDDCSFTTFWDENTERIQMLLFTDKASTHIYMWSGAVASLVSATANTITGSFPTGSSWGAAGFLAAGTRKVIVNGTEYTYTGGEATDTLTGVTPDPSSEPASSVVVQAVRTIANSDVTDVPPATVRGIISTVNNQIYLTSPYEQSVYVSKVDNYLDFSFTSPTRATGEGARLSLDAVPTALIPQKDSMLISAGQNWWYKVELKLSADNAKEALIVTPRRSTSLQSAKSDKLTTNIKNQTAFLSQENQLNVFGSLENFADAEVIDISIPVAGDFASIDFTGGSLEYHKNYLYLTAPLHGILYMYNMTSPEQQEWFWEAPQTMPFSVLSPIGGNIHGHSYNKGETFRMFYGNSDNGVPFICRAVFAYDSYGYRAHRKTASQIYVEGLKSRSTKLYEILRKSFGSDESTFQWETLPSRCAVKVDDDASIGKTSIGKSPIGTSAKEVSEKERFRLIETFVPFSAFETQTEFWSEGVGQDWEIACYGVDAVLDEKIPTDIKDPNKGETI